MTVGLLTLALALAAQPADPTFRAVGPAADEPAGRLARLTPELTAELVTAAGPVAVPAVVALRRTDRPRPPFPNGPALLTTTGDRIPGRLVGGDGLALKFRPDFLPAAAEAWTVPATSVGVVWLDPSPADTPADPARYPWLAGNRRRDVVLLRNGDALRGTLDAVADAVRLTTEDGTARTVPLATVHALAFDPSLARTRRPAGPYARVVLADGTRLDVMRPTADGDTLRGKTVFGQAVELPVAEVVAIDLFWDGPNPRVVPLAELKPTAQAAGFLGPAWPWAADRTVRGDPLRVLTANGTDTADRGVGTHPKTTLTYALAGKYLRFDAVVGLDADTGGRGRAVVRVLVDGVDRTPAELKRDLTPGPAVPIRVDLAGAKELTLVVDFGPNGGVRADVNWADARLIPAGP